MNTRTEVNMWTVGGSIISTVHRIEADGQETSDVLNVAEPMELSFAAEPAPDLSRGTERVYDWR
jgi:hypothetical protein